ncbi:tetratricopeptide repeat protein [Flavobacteriaceae bacterium]|jgi:tetratricopeptide (TPR) repeat protein|nr:tetratricopeptide repeat protein [Flavobacteriaceae bacterium]MDA7727613.1 tetratricopeptide repeat protein [Flavobacteriaceae bacterium]MDA7848770.1 tetratricopeptide repeat protein [Flavobacteriaceae bacterium]MDB0003827.1 tetratricopeptide repeat protein [Flavobacteriaceae bacterium]
MKKYFVLLIALTLGFSVVAQKKEIKTAAKELDKGNYEKAGVALDAAEALLGSMDEKYKSQYYLYRSMYYLNNGEPDFSTIKKSIEALKLATAPAQEQGVKNQTQNIKVILVNKASSLLQTDEYVASSDYFESAYKLAPNDTVYLFYAASTAVNAKLYDRSLVMYEELRSLGYTGIEQNFLATNKETQVEEQFGSEMLRNLSLKAKTHINPKDEKTKSKFPEIIKNIALIYVQNGDNEKALQAMAVARAEAPEDLNLLLTEANVYYSMGNSEKFKELLEVAIQKDPENPELQYNLGVISTDTNDFESAKKYYLRAIELKSDYINAYINLAALILGQEESILEEMNKLGSSAADDRKYDELKEKRNQLYLDAIPYLESAFNIDPNNYQASKTLANIFSAVGDTDKYKEFKAISDALEPK